MTVGELTELLSGFPVDTLVVMATDEEGNNFYPVDSYSECHYDADEDEVSFPEDNVEDLEDIDDEDEVFELNAICLWP